VNATTDRAGLDAKHRGDLQIRETVDVAENDNSAKVADGELGEDLAQVPFARSAG
jgi:hypothetical protein